MPHQVAPQSIETISLLDIPIWLFSNAGWSIWRGIAPANCLGGFSSGKAELFGVGGLRIVDHGGGHNAAIPEEGVLLKFQKLVRKILRRKAVQACFSKHQKKALHLPC